MTEIAQIVYLMLLIRLSVLGAVVASSDSPTRGSIKRVAHRGYDEYIEDLAGIEGAMRGWLSPIEVALQLCNQVETTQTALSGLVAAGSFRGPLQAIHTLQLYNSEWKDMFDSMPMTAIIAWARGNIDMTAVSRMATMITDYTHRLNTECGFRFLPASLQRHHDLIFGESNPSDFRIITQGLEKGQLAHFPDAIETDDVTPITANFGRFFRNGGSWYYDIERSCTVVSVHCETLSLIPELGVAVQTPDLMDVMGPDYSLTVWFASSALHVPVAEIFGLTDPLKIVFTEIEKIRMLGDFRHFTFHASLENEGRIFSKVIVFDVLNDRKPFVEHPLNHVNAKFAMQGGIAISTVMGGIAVALVPDARLEGDYPDPQPSRIVMKDQYLVDSSLDEVIDVFRESLNRVMQNHDFQDQSGLSDEQKNLVRIHACVNGDDPRSEECQDLIAIALTGKPDSYLAIRSMVNAVLGNGKPITLTRLEHL